MTTKSSATKGARHGSIMVVVHDSDDSEDGGPVAFAQISVYRSDAQSCVNFDGQRWLPDPARLERHDRTDPAGSVVFRKLDPGFYVVSYDHYPLTEPVCVEVDCGCTVAACFTLGMDVGAAFSSETPDCQPSNCRRPRPGYTVVATVGYTGDAALRNHVGIQANAPWVRDPEDPRIFTMVPRRAGTVAFDYTLQLPLLPSRTALPSGGEPSGQPGGGARAASLAAAAPPAAFGAAGPNALIYGNATVVVDDSSATVISGNVGVSLSRTETEPTEDLPLWTLIRNSTEAMSFTNYLHFIDGLFCKGSLSPPVSGPAAQALFNTLVTRRTLPFVDADSYRVLKAATEAFVMVNCGVLNPTLPFNQLADSAYLDRRDIPAGADIAADFDDYLEAVDGTTTLPYLAIIRRKLPDVPITLPSVADADLCFGIVQRKLANPCMLELIWSYWHEEGMLVQTMNAITRRFQNVRSAGTIDPLANLEIDPLRPLNNLIWGYTQDEQHRLTVMRRNYEYDHHYGVRLDGKAVQSFHPADSRSKFLEAFHFLLRLCTAFYRQDDDTTVKADAFPILNALREVHLILSQGAHNQFGDLPSTARVEMLMQQWLLSRPEFREFLPTRIMVAYPEPWMDRVDAMKKLQGWSDTSVTNFRTLAVFGEQLLLSIRYGNWSDIYEPTPAFNWARFWRPQVQGYIHSYRAATGVDLTVDARDPVAEGTLPSVLMRQRLDQQLRLS
jgi:hypothetical protein